MLKKYILAIIIVTLFFLGVINIPFLNKIYPNIYVSGIYLGDKSKEEALAVLKDKFALPDKFVLNVNGNKNEILTSEIITNIDFDETINRAYNYGSFNTKLSLIFKPVNLYPIVTINEDKLLETLLIISDKIGNKPVSPSVKKSNQNITVDSGKDGIAINLQQTKSDILKSLLFTLDNREITVTLDKINSKLSDADALQYKINAEKLIGKEIKLKLDYDVFIINDTDLISYLTPTGFSDEKIKSKILEISRILNQNPQNSVFIIENGKVEEFTPSKEGITVDETLLLELIKNLQSEITIPVIKTSPKIKNEDVNNLGINTLLGIGKSNFVGSIPNRIHNVNLAQSKFKGLLVPPNEIVSFNDVLGDVSAFTGYKSAYVIKDGKTVLGDGGGVCQVSTTLFRAVLSAGLPVIERKAHAYRVGYYEQGFAPGIDATVYSPTADFKFKNDTSAYILIQPSIDLNKLFLSFEIYGTSDGRISETIKPVILSSTAPASDLYVDDPTLPVGTIRQIEHRAYGAKVVFNYKVTRGNEILIDEKFVSNYRPWQAVYLRGTASQ